MLEYFTNFPHRLIRLGLGVLVFCVSLSLCALMSIADEPMFPMPHHPNVRLQSEDTPLSFCLDSSSSNSAWDLASIEEELLITFSPARPGGNELLSSIQVRLKSAQQTRRVSLPGRIYFSYNDRGVLGFNENSGPFWADFSLDDEGRIQANVTVERKVGEIQTFGFSRRPGSPLPQKSDEFVVGSPIRILADAKWSGTDLLFQLYSTEAKQRIEIANNFYSLSEDDWLCWDGQRWTKEDLLPSDSEKIVARLHVVSTQLLEWDVWSPTNTRLSCALQPLTASHIKPEEWMNALRVRSEKQISCSIEKQSFVLRKGDWVFKENGHWRVLRKAEDRRRLIEGKKSGDLFVLEKIDSKNKGIQGKLFLANRTQMINVENNASTLKNSTKTHASQDEVQSRKGKNS